MTFFYLLKTSLWDFLTSVWFSNFFICKFLWLFFHNLWLFFTSYSYFVSLLNKFFLHKFNIFFETFLTFSTFFLNFASFCTSFSLFVTSLLLFVAFFKKFLCFLQYVATCFLLLNKVFWLPFTNLSFFYTILLLFYKSGHSFRRVWCF